MTHHDDPGSPTTKQGLLDRIRTEWAAWETLLARMPPARFTEPALAGGWSVNDVVAHVAAYERWTAAQLRAAREGRKPGDQEQYGTKEPSAIASLKTLDMDARNAALRVLYHDRPAAEMQIEAAHLHDALVAEIEAQPESALLDPDAQAWTGGMPPIDLLPGETYDHYAHHAADIQRLVD